jgi:hypothetical protein
VWATPVAWRKTLSGALDERLECVFKKSLPEEMVTKSTSLILVSIGIIGSSLFMVLIGNAASRLLGWGHGRTDGFVLKDRDVMLRLGTTEDFDEIKGLE